MEPHPPADNTGHHFLTMMVRATRAVDLLRVLARKDGDKG